MTRNFGAESTAREVVEGLDLAARRAIVTGASGGLGAETARLLGRLDGLGPEQVEQVRIALKRVADKLIHAPTVRVQQLVDGPAGLTYADALSDLFALDPATVDAVTQVKGGKG